MRTLFQYLLVLFTTSTLSVNTYALTLIDDAINPIRIFAIFHDDVPEPKRYTAYGEHIRHFTDEFEKITGRKIRVIFDENHPPYSNFNYKSEDPNSMFEKWKELAWQYKAERHDKKQFLFSKNDRVVLLTNELINGTPLLGGMAGLASRPGYSAIASLVSSKTVGHEVGHTFNAVHEDAEILYNGWWCETYMYPMTLVLRSNCNVFSEANRKRIKNYVDSLY